jgi:uncharacterized protein (DUF1499 family)
MKNELISLISLAAIVTCCSGKVSESVGVKDGKLAQCPDKPNCVSSLAGDKIHFIEPFKYSADFNKAKQALIDTIKSQDRAAVISDSENYIHAEFRSRIFRFTDDVEFLFDDETKTVHLRSASRLGYSDMGVNRKRIENLREIFYSKMK